MAIPSSVEILSQDEEVKQNTNSTANGCPVSHDGRGEEVEIPKFTSTSYPSNCLRFMRNSTRLETADDATTTPAKTKLEILIVGAGIGGLATAVALRRRGHVVTVFEQAPELMEVREEYEILN